MNEEILKRIEDLEFKVDLFVKQDRYLLQRNLEFFNGKNVKLGLRTGTKIGTATNQKLGFFNKTPIIQVSAISAPSGGATIDSEARTAINSIRTALTNLGLTA